MLKNRFKSVFKARFIIKPSLSIQFNKTPCYGAIKAVFEYRLFSLLAVVL